MRWRSFLLVMLAFLIPVTVFAHEVYVLPKEVILRDLTLPPLQVFSIIAAETGRFFFWAFISAWAICSIFVISISKGFERRLDPWLDRVRTYAPLVGRLTLGAAISASGYYGALFGPELPFTDFLPAHLIGATQAFLIIAGILVVAGLFTRIVALLLAVFYLAMWIPYGWYMLTYLNYFGEIALALVAGNATLALDRYVHHRYPRFLHGLVAWLEEHPFMVLRVCFGISLIFASFYAKLIHAQLALDTVTMYGLTNYFPFDPPFIVLGAFCVELLLGLFFLFGIEVRFASLFLLFWLTLSLLYFGEVVWPHIILAGAAVTIFLRGYDRHTLEWGLMRRHGVRHKPVL